jgi:hypothetical protein
MAGHRVLLLNSTDAVGISGNARIAGLNTDLNLTGLQYNTAVTLFFPPYCLFEVPSNIVLKIIRPSVWLSILLFCWGIDLAFLVVFDVLTVIVQVW